MVITDSQVHLWEAHRPDRPWPAEFVAKPVFVASHGARPHRETPLGAEELLATLDACGVERAIIVPPSPVGDENLTGLEAAARHPSRLAVMGRFDPTAPGAQARLESWLGQRGMLGIRMTFHLEKWSRWLEGDTLDEFWRGCERLGIPVMIFVPGLVEKVHAIAERHPGLALILDHMARKSELRDAACFADLDALLALARHPNVFVKTSAVPCYSTEPYPFANLTPYLRRIHDTFGAKRLMWGSDCTRLPCTYRECLDHFRVALDFLDAEDKRWILGGTLETVLRWPTA